MMSEISGSGKYVIAFSGGADSRYLLEKFLEKIAHNILSKQQVIVAHFNHNLRAEESMRDQKFSSEISQQNGLIFETKTWTDTHFSENSARNARYNFLEEIRKKYNADWVVTAHHQDDQAETVFLQFMRGGGVNALSGMQKFSPNRKIFRPLLPISKAEILQELSQKNIRFVEDSSNAESYFTRNFLRNEIFPQLEKKFPKFAQRLADKTCMFQEMQKDFESLAQNFFDTASIVSGAPHFSRKKFLNLISPVQFEVVKKIIAPKFCDQKIFLLLRDFIQSASSGKKFQTQSVTVQVFGENFFFSPSSE